MKTGFCKAMRKSQWRKALLAISLVLLLLAQSGCQIAPRNLRKPLPLGRKMKVIGFFMDLTGPDSSFESLKRYADYIDVVSPMWIIVNEDGSIQDNTSMEVIRFARSRGIKVIPLVALNKSKDTVLVMENARLRAVTNILAAVRKYNFDGVNIDFEIIPTTAQTVVRDKNLITEFMRMISRELKKMNKVVQMSIVPPFQTAPTLAGLYDIPSLAKMADHIVLMTYDKHEASSPPGPVAPLAWAENNLKRARELGLKPEQTLLGVATYGYDWPEGQPGGFSSPTKEILAKARRKGIEIKWSREYQEPYYIYYNPVQGRNREVWFENSVTMKQKIDLAKKYGIYGIAVWRLGFETPKHWEVVAQNIGRR